MLGTLVACSLAIEGLRHRRPRAVRSSIWADVRSSPRTPMQAVLSLVVMQVTLPGFSIQGRAGSHFTVSAQGCWLALRDERRSIMQNIATRSSVWAEVRFQRNDESSDKPDGLVASQWELLQCVFHALLYPRGAARRAQMLFPLQHCRRLEFARLLYRRLREASTSAVLRNVPQFRSLRNAVSEFPQPIKRLVCESVGNGSSSRAPDNIIGTIISTYVASRAAHR